MTDFQSDNTGIRKGEAAGREGEKVRKSDSDWREQLSPEEYRITRQKGTEPPFTGKYYHHHETGVYRCVCCDAPLFTSDTKYESGSGWPSFWQPISPDAVEEHQDLSHMMIRTEVVCRRCGAHLGHIFDAGPQPTGQRFCVNSASLRFDDSGG